MIDILIQLLIVCVIAGAIIYVAQLLGLPEPWGRIVQIVVAVLVLIWLLQLLVPLLSHGSGRRVVETLVLLA